MMEGKHIYKVSSLWTTKQFGTHIEHKVYYFLLSYSKIYNIDLHNRLILLLYYYTSLVF